MTDLSNNQKDKMNLKKDYRVGIKIRNNNILRAIESIGMVPGQKFSDAAGIRYFRLIGYINMTDSPIDADGNLKQSAADLCAFLNKSCDELWSLEQLTALDKNSVEIELSSGDVARLMPSYDPVAAIEHDEAINFVDGLLSGLTQREEKVLRLRYGLDGEQKTLAEIGEEFGVQRERIRQIEAKALRKLKSRNDRGDVMEMAGDFANE